MKRYDKNEIRVFTDMYNKHYVMHLSYPKEKFFASLNRIIRLADPFKSNDVMNEKVANGQYVEIANEIGPIQDNRSKDLKTYEEIVAETNFPYDTKHRRVKENILLKLKDFLNNPDNFKNKVEPQALQYKKDKKNQKKAM